jgi:hypothetical protein
VTKKDSFEDFLNSKKGIRLAEDLIHSVFTLAVADGRINAEGKSDEELRQELVKLLSGYAKSPEIEILWIIDYRATVLQQDRLFYKNADSSNKSGNYRLACLLYGTWFEHWLNRLIATAGKRRGLNEDELTQIIRDTPFRGKLTWMFPLLGLRHLPTNHKNAIFKITDLRNSFVHYKWKGKGDEADEQEERELANSLAQLEKTVKYLNHYESKYVFHRKKKALRKIVKIDKGD